MIMILIVLIGIVGALGYFAIGTVRQMFFNKVDIVLDAGHGGEDPGAYHAGFRQAHDPPLSGNRPVYGSGLCRNYPGTGNMLCPYGGI
mgnify:CR=1 FL=1